MNNISIKQLTLMLYGADPPGNIYKNYIKSRGVCGIVIALGGHSEYCFSDGRKKILKKGEIALFSDKCAYIVKNTSSEYFPHYTINFSLNPGCALPSDEAYLKPCDISRYILECEKLYSLARSPVPYSNMYAVSILYNILADILSDEQLIIVDHTNYTSIFPAINYIETEYQKPINIEYLASLCAMSKTSFRRTFTLALGISPINYLINIRIERAKELVRHTALNINEIAFLCGFKDTEHFCRTFKKRTGSTAMTFRLGIKENAKL